MSELTFERTITQEDMTRFAGAGRGRSDVTRTPAVGNHHTDPRVAEAAGLQGTVAQALHYCAYVSHLMLTEHGKDWVEGGELEMVFVQPLYAGDTIRVSIADSGGTPPASVECHNQHGQLLATGQVHWGER